jgi:hypothetical protein
MQDGVSPSSVDHKLVALAKLLSPSHAIQSISLYSQFCDYLERKCDTKNPFTSLVVNWITKITGKDLICYMSVSPQNPGHEPTL